MEVFQTDEDDWIIDSLQKYESLYMFELQYPTRCMEWSRNNSAVCVAGYSLEHPNEIMQLSLPEKLLSLEKQTLWAKRDFKLINGAITKNPVTCLKHVEHADTLLSSGNDPSITLWASDCQESDLLVKKGEIELKLAPSLKPSLSKVHSTLMDVSSTILLAASSLSLLSMQTIDIETKKPLFNMASESCSSHSNEVLHGIKFVSEDGRVFVSCSGEKGSIGVWDTRERTSIPSQPHATKPSQLLTFDLAVSHGPSTKIAVLRDDGQLELYDSRDVNKPFAFRRCVDSSKSEAAPSGFRGQFSHSVRQPCVEFCPGSGSKLLSVSGVTGGVQVYDTSQWSCDMEAPSPVFVHGGHEQESPGAAILVHSWQPGVERGTVFSADNEGSLHAWQWREQN